MANQSDLSPFTVAELLEIEQALEGHDSDDLRLKAAIDSAFLKVGIALSRPWALQKQREKAQENAND